MIPACLGAALAALLALYFAWVAVTVPFPAQDERFVETSDRLWTEVLVLPIAACLGYAAYSLIRYALGKQVRWTIGRWRFPHWSVGDANRLDVPDCHVLGRADAAYPSAFSSAASSRSVAAESLIVARTWSSAPSGPPGATSTLSFFRALASA